MCAERTMSLQSAHVIKLDECSMSARRVERSTCWLNEPANASSCKRDITFVYVR